MKTARAMPAATPTTSVRFVRGMPSKTPRLSCPIQRTIALVADKWKVLIVEQMRSKPVRFNELHRALDGVTPRVLSRQLKELEFDGLIHRHDYQEIPPRVEYVLTTLGASLLPVFDQLNEWATIHHKQVLTAHERVTEFAHSN